MACGLLDAAKAGEFRMPEGVARRLGDACDRLVAGLQQAKDSGRQLTEVTGFAALPSGVALARGFAAKGCEYAATLTAFQEVALRYKAAYLTAGALFEEADAAAYAALAFVAADLD